MIYQKTKLRKKPRLFIKKECEGEELIDLLKEYGVILIDSLNNCRYSELC